MVRKLKVVDVVESKPIVEEPPVEETPIEV
jgi:hypothetical protein